MAYAGCFEVVSIFFSASPSPVADAIGRSESGQPIGVRSIAKKSWSLISREMGCRELREKKKHNV